MSYLHFHCIILTTSLLVGVNLFKLNVPRVLLPHNVGVPSNFSLEVFEAQPDDCFEWHSSDIKLVMINPDFPCSRTAFVSAVSCIAKHQEAFVSVSLKGSKVVIFIDVIIDIIHHIGFLSRTSQITLGSPPIVLSLVAVNNDGHTFDSLGGVPFQWSIENFNSELSSKSRTIVRFVDGHENYKISNVTGDPLRSSHSKIFEAVNIGSVTIHAHINREISKDSSGCKMVLDVVESEELKPCCELYILPLSKVKFHLETKYGQVNERLPSLYRIKVQNSSVAQFTKELTVHGLNCGDTDATFEAENGQSYKVSIHVVEPQYIGFTVLPERKWILHEAKAYDVYVNLFDSFDHKIHPSENMKFSVTFPSRLFYVNSSSSSGQYHSVRTLVPGSNVIRASFIGTINEKGFVEKMYNLSISEKATIYQAIHLFPSVLVLPFYHNISAMYSIPFKVTGGTGSYLWSTNNPAAKITETGDNKIIVNFYSEGDFVITVKDGNCSAFYASAKVSIQEISEIEVYPTVVETEVGNDLVIPVALLGFENKDRRIYRKFDDCSRINISVAIVEKHIVSYEEGAYVPAFGSGCLSLQFLCKFPGHSRINIQYQSEETSLKTTLVVACFKKLKPVHPVRAAVLALGTSKEIVFEGGPRPWPLLPERHFMNLTEQETNYLDIQIVKDPIRYNKDLHVFQVLCKQLGETDIWLHIGNEASPTNQNSARLQSSIKIICAEPKSLHISYNSKQQVKGNPSISNKHIIKVPFYGRKVFELDIWVKDSIGRKFANISSLGVYWEASDYTITKPLHYRDFNSHIDGSAGYRKISRDFQEFEMTEKIGHATVKAKLTGYRKDILEKENIINYKKVNQISQSIDLEFVSLRDIYDDVYSANTPQNHNENYEEEACKS